MSKSRGFTLIEVMIVVAIVAILSAVAMPAYNDYIIRGKLSEARSALDSQRVKMEQYFQDNRTYVGACASVLATPDVTTHWTLACSGENATQYLVTATPTAAGPAGFSFTINQANTRVTTAVPPTGGWTLPGSNCWVTKKGGVC